MTHAPIAPEHPGASADGRGTLGDTRADGWRRRISARRVAALPIAAIVYCVAKYYRGGDSLVRAGDGLDHKIPLYEQLTLGQFFGPPGQELDFILGGLPRDVIGSEFSIGSLLHLTLPMLLAFFVVELGYRTLAYVGMRRLLRTLGLADPFLLVAIPTLFSLLPYWHFGFGSVPGTPLVLSALLALHRLAPDDRIPRREFAILAVFPTLSYPSGTFAYLLLAGAAFVVLAVARRTVRGPVFFGLGTYAVAALLVEWRLVTSALFGPTTHRIDMRNYVGSEWAHIGNLPHKLLFEDSLHAEVVKTFPLLALLLFGGSVLFLRRAQLATEWKVFSRCGVAWTAFASTELWWGNVEEDVLAALLDEYARFDITRVLWLGPVLVYAMVAAIGAGLLRSADRRLAVGLLSLALGLHGIAIWQRSDFNRPSAAQLSINDFYSTEVFEPVRDRIDATGPGLAVSVGFLPAVTIYNGIDSADGYWFTYPVDDKRRFEALLQPAIDADPLIEQELTRWGSRAYVFVPGNGHVSVLEVSEYESLDLRVDSTQFEPLGIRYVLASAPLVAPGADGLALLDVFSHPDRPYTIHLYEYRG